MMVIEQFEVTPDHIKLLQAMYVDWNDSENGAPTINPKRPYGNSDVTCDIAKILGWDLPEDEDEIDEKYNIQADKIHREMETCLQILLVNMSIEQGIYEKESYRKDWKKKL
jgi:hypothetical protein